MVYNGNERDKYKKKSIYQKEIMKGQIETDKKNPMMKGQKENQWRSPNNVNRLAQRIY